MSKVLTISIAAYNVERFLDKTLSSLMEPSVLDDIEVIVVNDGSKDRTREIAEEYQKKYSGTVKVINKENGGYGSTINSSLSIAEGKYYKLLDGDDWYLTHNLPLFIDALKKSECDIIYTPFYFVEEPEENKRIEKFSFKEGVVLPSSDIYALCMHAMAVRTDLIKGKIKISEHSFYTDFEFDIKSIELSSTFTYFDIPIYCYRIGLGEQSVSIKGYLKHVDEHERMTKYSLSSAYGSKKFKALRHQVDDMARRHINILIVNGDRKKYIEFIEYLRKNYPHIKRWESRYQILVSWFPYLLFNVVSRIKRKKNNLD